MPKKFLLVFFFLFFLSSVSAITLTDLNLYPTSSFNGDSIIASGSVEYSLNRLIGSEDNNVGIGTSTQGWWSCQDFNFESLGYSFSLARLGFKYARSNKPDCNNVDVGLFEDLNSDGKFRQFVARTNPDINLSTYRVDRNGATDYRGLCDWNYSQFWNESLTEIQEVVIDNTKKYSVCFYYDLNLGTGTIYSALNYPFEMRWQLSAGNFTGSYSRTDFNSIMYVAGTPRANYDVYLEIFGDTSNSFKLACGDSNFSSNLCVSASYSSFENSCSFENPFDANLEQGYSDNNVFCRAFTEDTNSNILSETLRTYPPLDEILTCDDLENVDCFVGESIVWLDVIDSTESAKFSFDLISSVSVPVNVYFSSDFDKNMRYVVLSGDDAEDLSVDDTLLFGSGIDDAMQKHWNPAEEFWEFTQVFTVAPSSTTYYEYRPESLFYYEESLEDSLNWDMQSNPEWDSDLRKDVYHVSAYQNIDSLSRFELPDVNNYGSRDGVAVQDYMYFQFNAYPQNNSETQDLWIGSKTTDGWQSATDYSLFEEGEATNNFMGYDDWYYSALVEPNFVWFYTQNETSSDILMSDYSLTPTGYFLTPLTVKNVDGSALEVLSVDYSQLRDSFSEGTPLRVQTTIKGDDFLDSIEVKAYYYTVDDVNRVYYRLYDYNAGNSVYDFDVVVPAFFDLTQNAEDRDVRIVVKLNFISGYSEIRSDWLLMRQFPANPADLSFSFTQTSRTIGSYPQGYVYLKSNNPDIIKGLMLYIRPVGDTNNSILYFSELVKGRDFQCTGFTCNFSYKINDYVFPSAGYYEMSLVVETYAEQFFTLSEPPREELYGQIYFVVQAKVFDTLRVFQVLERNESGLHQYRNTEEIPLVLQLRDSPDLRGGYPNVKDDIDVWMEISICDVASGGSCVAQTQRYAWNRFVYDESTGYNYFFFNNLFVDSSGDLLQDGDFVRIKVYVQDKSNRHNWQQEIGYLARKCKTYDPESFWIFLLTMNQYYTGCTEFSSTRITTTENTDEERRIRINNSRETLSPSQDALVCVKMPDDSVFKNALDQSLWCAVVYNVGEEMPNRWNLIISNENSNLSEINPDYQQFINVSVPAELIIFNDPNLMKQALSQEFDTEINTVGDALWYGFNKIFNQVANPLATFTIDTFYKNRDLNSKLGGAYVNVGADFNFQNEFDPRYISGIFFYKVHGFKVINAYDYRYEDEMQDIPLDDFVKWAKQSGVSLREDTTKVDVYVSDLDTAYSVNAPSRLVINESPETAEIDKTKLSEDANYSDSLKTLRFNVISDMIWHNEVLNQRAYIPFAITTELPFLNGVGNVFFDFVATIQGVANGELDPFDVLIGWTFKNILFITVVIMLLVMVAYIRLGWVNR